MIRLAKRDPEEAHHKDRRQAPLVTGNIECFQARLTALCSVRDGAR